MKSTIFFISLFFLSSAFADSVPENLCVQSGVKAGEVCKITDLSVLSKPIPPEGSTTAVIAALQSQNQAVYASVRAQLEVCWDYISNCLKACEIQINKASQEIEKNQLTAKRYQTLSNKTRSEEYEQVAQKHFNLVVEGRMEKSQSEKSLGYCNEAKAQYVVKIRELRSLISANKDLSVIKNQIEDGY